MASLVCGPIRAKFQHCPDDSKVKYAEGKIGVLEIYVSENKMPGDHFAVFYFSSDVDNPFESDINFKTDLYIKTSICKLEIKENELILNRDKGDAFIFKKLDRGVEEDSGLLN